MTSTEYDRTDKIDASIARYAAGLTNARIDTPGQPPTSTLTIFNAMTKEVFGEWTLGAKEFWTDDPEIGAIAEGTWDVNKRCYMHDVWTGDYSPGTPLIEHASREFCF